MNQDKEKGAHRVEAVNFGYSQYWFSSESKIRKKARTASRYFMFSSPGCVMTYVACSREIVTHRYIHFGLFFVVDYVACSREIVKCVPQEM